MADRILFIGWNRVVAGREQQAMQLWQKSMEFYGGLQSNGRIDSFEPVLLSAHGGDLNGYMILRGDADKLAGVQEDDNLLTSLSRRIIVWTVLESSQATSGMV